MRRQTTSHSSEAERLGKVSWDAVSRLLRLAMPYRGPLLLAAVLTLITTGITLALPLVVRGAVNTVVETKQVGGLDRAALLVAGLVLFSSLVGYAQFMLVARAGNRIVNGMRADVFSHLQRLPVAFFDRSRSGDLASHLSNDVTLLQSTLTDDLVRLAGNLVMLLGGIVLVFVIDWRLTLVVVSLLMVTMAFFVFFGRKLRKLTRAALDALSDAMGTMSEALANARLVKAFGREGHEDRRAGDRLEGVVQLNLRAAVWEGMMGSVAGAGFVLVLLGVVWYGGRAVLDGRLSPGDLLAFLMTVTLISGPMASLASLYSRLQRAIGAADRLFGLLDETPEHADRPDAGAFPQGPGEVRFERVSFRYVDDTPVLRELDLLLPAGKVTAIVGPSGSGKTTLTSLLFRFYEPQSGRVLVDGVPLDQIRREDLREHLGLVPQDPILFNGTLRENIRYGRLEATDAEVEAAAREANVEEFVLPLPGQYETMIGERGITLSGGQRQRVAIARAVLKNPRILVLDEATSALDTRSETLVREALDRLMRGRTTLIIAHRLTTVQRADQIAVVEGGRVVETGTHEELLAQGGSYAGLHELVG